MAFAITEPDAGSNSHRITTTARRDGSDWILSGQKVYISGVDQAQAVLVVGRTEEAKTGNLKPALFVVPTDTPGLSWTKIDMEIVSPENQFQLFLDDVRLPADALVGSEDAAIAQLFAGLNPERIMGAASAVGMGRFAINKATDYVKTRQVWKTPIGAHQGISHPLAQNHIEIELAKLMMQKAATLYDLGDDGGAAEAANMAKYAAGEASVRAVDQAVQSPRRQRTDQGVRHRVGADRVAAGPHRPGQPRDDPQLRRADVAGPAPVVLIGAGYPRLRVRRSDKGRKAMTELVHYAVDGAVARLTLDSPHNRNALSTALVQQLHDGLRRAAADPDVRVRGARPHRRHVLRGRRPRRGGRPRSRRRRRRPGPRDDRSCCGRSSSCRCRSSARSTATCARAASGCRRVRHRRRRTDEHVRADRGAHRRGAVDHLADAAAEDDPHAPPGATSSPARSSAPTRPPRIGLITVATDDVEARRGLARRPTSRRVHRRAWPRRRRLTTAAILAGFDRHAEALDRRSRRGCSSPTRRARACWRSCEKRPPRWVR